MAGGARRKQLCVRFGGSEPIDSFPNPYVVRDGALLFGYLPLEATVSIYDVSGQLVRRLAELDGDGGVRWNGKNEAGVSVASGMYYYRIDAGSQSKVGSLAIVR